MEQSIHCSGGSGDVLQAREKQWQIQHGHEDEELGLALLKPWSPKGCTVAH